jgi:CheY-like chemotaxis protein/anti-sigma regulatory factor (Ser/Thr protein kinase)
MVTHLDPDAGGDDRLRSALAAAEEANRLKDEFLAVLSHELRTPLNAILGWARILRAGTLADADIPRALETIERNAQVQAQLIEDLLDVSRIVSGKLRLEMRPVDISEVIEEAVDTVRPTADARGITMTVVVNHVGPVSGDAHRLQQVVWNLLSNSIKFTPTGGRVDLRVDQTASMVRITVADTGQGIDAEFLPHVFDRFRQASSTPGQTRRKGLGLGLAIVRHLVEAHAGTVDAASDGAGRGATFTVEIPVMVGRTVLSTEPRHGYSPSTLESHLSLAGIRVLVVDDDADAREMLKIALEQYSAVVRMAASAQEALEEIAVERPDVLVSDIEMPDTNGYELVRQLRHSDSPELRRLPAVALTAYARTEDRVKALLAGFQTHVPKPVEPAELVTVIASLAQRTLGS